MSDQTTDPEVRALLEELSGGDAEALDELVTLVYEELRTLAHRHLHREDAGHTLNTTALVHEAYLRLSEIRHMEWQGRTHFFAMASRLMRRILINYARMRRRLKRGGGRVRVPLTNAKGEVEANLDDLLALDEALRRLEERNPRQCRVVECRFFAGLTVEDTAAVLDVSAGTVKRDWRLARLWLNRQLASDPATPEERDHG